MKKSSLSFYGFILLLIIVLKSDLASSLTVDSENTTTNKICMPNQGITLDPTITADTVNLTVLYINDWHGWLEPHDGRGGAATYMGYFKQEGFTSTDDSFLLLNGGDENTGPAVATLTKGESMMDVMNAMNFTASVVGNHEFDYGIEWMNYRKDMANFPVLSSNIFDNGTTNLANFTVPWVIQEHAGIQVGIIGLTTTLTETAAHPKYTQYYDFGNYEAALRANIPTMVEAGAEVIIVLSHIAPDPLISLAANVADLNIALFLGGHAGTPQVTKVGDSLVVMAGHYAQHYARIDLEIDASTTPMTVSSSGVLVDNIEGGVTPVTEIQQIVDYWVNLVNADAVISYASTDIYDSSPESGIGNLVADGMLDYFSWTYDFSFTNIGGGIRDYFRAGDITIGDVVSVIPFENEILEISISGQELLNILSYGHGYQAIGNIRYSYNYDGGFHITSAYINSSGVFSEINPSTTYIGLMIDYMWWVSYKDDFPAIGTGVMYRDTAIIYISKIPDISLIALDGRIQEGYVVIPEFAENNLVLTIIPLICILLYTFRKNKHLEKRFTFFS